MLANNRHLTQWAAQFAVASELCKRGYEVAFTLGHNTPLADLMVVSPKGKEQFLIDVKGLARQNYWTIKKQEARTNLFYVLALVPRAAQNAFFVLTQEQINRFIDNEFCRASPESQAKGAAKLRLGVRWKDADQPEYRDAWSTLPQ